MMMMKQLKEYPGLSDVLTCKTQQEFNVGILVCWCLNESMEEIRNTKKIMFENPKGKELFGDLCLSGKMILKLSWRK
jgi:hypothetical protein